MKWDDKEKPKLFCKEKLTFSMWNRARICYEFTLQNPQLWSMAPTLL